MRRLSILVLGLLAASCASSPLEDPHYRAQVARLKVYETDERLPQGARVIGAVKGTSCKRNLYSTDNPKESQAFLQLKFGAVRLGANAVANIVCEDQGTSLASNCWKSVVCYGDAVLLPTPSSGQ
jgi:hypothetical protein